MTTLRNPNAHLRTLLAQADWTHGQLARAVNAAAARHNLTTRYDRTSVAHWLTGTRPRPPVPDLIREVLANRLARPLTLHDTGLSDPTPATPATDPLTRLLTLTRTDPDSEPHPYQPAITLPPHTPTTRTPPADSGHRTRALDDMTRLALFHLEAFGGGHIRVTLAAHLAETAVPWTARHRAPHLLSGTARLTHLLAHATADMGTEGLAQTYHLTAARLAAEADDPTLYAISLRALSTQAVRLGYTRLAARLARAALDATPHDATGATHAYLWSQLAVTLALDGRHRTALDALNRAETHLEHDTPPEPFDAYPLADFAYQKATVLTDLGQTSAALRALRTSLRARATHRTRSRALTRARLAELLHTTGHLEAACAQWATFLEESQSLWSAQATAHVTRMRTCLTPYRTHRDAADLLARTAA